MVFGARLGLAGPHSDGGNAVAALARAPAELVRRSQEAVRAFIRGDVAGYLSFVDIASDFTLMQPFGEVSRGFNRSPEWAKGIQEYFKDGEADVELVQSYASGDKPGDIAVLVTVEHQHARVGGLPDQQWPLRVTLVFRRGETDWELVHRHADLTVKRITLEQAAALRAENESARATHTANLQERRTGKVATADRGNSMAMPRCR